MNEDTRVVVFCYQGDSALALRHLPVHQSHRCPITIMSPENSPVSISASGVDNRLVGRRAYIGPESIARHRGSLSTCLEYPEKYFLLHDADSLCLSPEIPHRWHPRAEDCVFSGEIQESRPHSTPHPKIAMQPPYFLSRHTLFQLLTSAPVAVHPITPFIDWWWTAQCWNAKVGHLPHSSLMHASTGPAFSGSGPWETAAYSIRHCGAVMMHPIKDKAQLDIVCGAYAERDDQ